MVRLVRPPKSIFDESDGYNASGPHFFLSPVGSPVAA